MPLFENTFLHGNSNPAVISNSAIENKGVMVGVNPETQEKVIEKPIEKENENDSDDAYLVDSLTEAFTKSNPFGQPTYAAGENEGE